MRMSPIPTISPKLPTRRGWRLTEDQKDLLDAVTTFNIRARYPDYKGEFYKKVSKKFTEDYIKKIRDLRQWLIKKIKKQ